VEELLTDAGRFFETCLWDSETSDVARNLLAGEGLGEETIRAFGVGYAPIGPSTLLDHLRGLGYSAEDVVASGLARVSARGRVHAQFSSRLMFPVKDATGQILGFAGRALHLGPSWPLWVTSPDVGLYRRSQAVFGLDRAAGPIAATRTAYVERDCIATLRAHQDGNENAVAVHTPWVTRDQMLVMADGLPGGLDALELDLPPGMSADPKDEEASAAAPDQPASAAAGEQRAEPSPSHLKLKRMAIVVATAVAAVNVWTGAPLLAVWIGSHAQGGQVLSLRGVLIVLVVLGVLAFLLAWALAWLHAKYDQLTDRPATLTRTSPWYRRMRGELDDHFRTRYSLSAPERVVAACVIAGVLALEIWFFFFAGSPIGS
jgi:hypothetical protein